MDKQELITHFKEYIKQLGDRYFYTSDEKIDKILNKLSKSDINTLNVILIGALMKNGK